MARKRMIDPKFWSDDRMMELTPRHRLLFIGIWNFSDDSGIHKNNNTVLKAEIFPCDDISINEVGELKQGLVDAGLIIEFEDKDNKLFYVKNWNIYQKINRPQPSNYSLPDNSLSNHGTFTPNRIEQNRIEEKRKSSLSKEELSEFQKKYPGIDVNQSYNKFILNMKEKGKVIDDLAAAFEIWLMNDVKYDYNKRDKSNDLVTLHCVVCTRPKEVKRGIEERTTNCCGEPMLFYNEYLHEKSRRKEEEDKKVK